MKVLALTRYGALGASSRVRFYQYVPFLEHSGLRVEVASLFDDDYLRRLYAGAAADWGAVVKAYLKRISDLWRLHQYDLVWLEYEALPWVPAWLELALGLGRQRYVVDFDDAIFHRYDLHRSRLVRALLGGKIDRIMARSRMVFAGNQYLSDRARVAGARRVEILPTVVDTARYQPRYESHSEVFTIGWIGSPSTSHYLDGVVGAVSRLHKMGVPIRMVVVGGKMPEQESLPIVNLDWSEAGEVGMIQTFDVGVMPLPDNPWERGKCGYKLIQYMACGKPVVASPVGVNQSIVEPGVNGFLAENEEEWVGYLLRLYGNEKLRIEMGKAGRTKVESSFSLAVTSPKLVSFLRETANSKNHVR